MEIIQCIQSNINLFHGYDWCNKGRGISYPVCVMTHKKEPLLLIGKSSLCGGSGFSSLAILIALYHMSDAI